MKVSKINVSFMLPGRGSYPVGGFKVVYEYANRLAAQGYQVNLVHTAWLSKANPLLMGLFRYTYFLLFYRFYTRWFKLDENINDMWIFAPTDSSVPDADHLIATSWETSEHVASLSSKKGRKHYLIQGDEMNFPHTLKLNRGERVRQTWKLPLKKIVISTWLQNLVSAVGETSTKIFNGLDHKEFFVSKKIEERNGHTVMMLYHTAASKGCADGLAALKRSKISHDIKVILFGVPKRPNDLEDWIEYHQQPSREQLRTLYNRAEIFLSPSHAEGWGLPVAEAMQCGCAALTSDIPGFKDFIEDQHTGVCFRVKDALDISVKLEHLLDNPEYRKQIAMNGNIKVKDFTWDKSVEAFIKHLTN